jgi:hypothetical protein
MQSVSALWLHNSHCTDMSSARACILLHSAYCVIDLGALLSNFICPFSKDRQGNPMFNSMKDWCGNIVSVNKLGLG